MSKTRIPDGDYFVHPEGGSWYAARFRDGKWVAGFEESEAATHQAANDSWAGIAPADDDVEVPEWLARAIIDQVTPSADPEFVIVTRPRTDA